MEKKIQPAKNVILTAVTLNVCSIKSKLKRDLVLDQLKNITGKKPDIISLIETHLN